MPSWTRWPMFARQATTSSACAWVLAALSVAISSTSCADTVTTRQRTVTQVANGVYVIRHRDSPDGNVNGNTTVIIGDQRVLVVDSCFQLSAAADDIAQIQRWTKKPVAFLLLTHWHNDHNMGSGLYKAAYPALEVVSHSTTKRDMYRTPVTPSRFEQQIATRERQLASGRDANGKALTASDSVALQQKIVGKKQVLAELHDFVYQAPTLTFEHELDVDLGGREVQLLHLGRGPTSGDAVAFLPRERVLVAGDLVTHPVLFTYDGYPSEWVTTLDHLLELGPTTVVPGHGEVLHGVEYLHLSRDYLASAVDQVAGQLRHQTATIENPSLEAVRKGVDLAAFRARFAGSDPNNLEAFDEANEALIRVVYHEAMHNQ